MDNEKIGALIRRLRREQRLTQRGLAEQLGLSDKAVSKWERGLGCPEVSFLPRLSGIFGVDLERMLRGDLTPNELVGGNMKKLSYYVCPTCGNLTFCTGQAEVSCCGRKLAALVPQKAREEEQLTVELVETDWFITSSHPMRKDDYTIFEIGEKYKINPDKFLSKGKSTPFFGAEVYGRCLLTVCGGKTVWQENSTEN